jgi:predicted transcriptional regulator
VGRKKIGQVDLKTGEILDGLVAFVAPRRVNGFVEGWLAMGQLAVTDLAARRKELGEEGLAVFLVLVGSMGFENHVVISQAELGRRLGMHRQSVQKAIKRLIEMGVLSEGPKVGQNRSYQLNPSLAWKGSAENHKKALASQTKKRMKAAKITGVIKGGKAEEPK